jgi:putative membrane protein insertion efficiency factor
MSYFDPSARYDPYGYGRRGWGPPRRRPAGGSCLRDACLIESGCCIAESCDEGCLLLGFIALPHLLRALTSAIRAGRRPAARRHGGVTGLLIAAIRVYQREVSAHRPPCCRFFPSCSEYAVRALQAHGARHGCRLTVKRLVRCRPGGPRGYDPVPTGGGRPGPVTTTES